MRSRRMRKYEMKSNREVLTVCKEIVIDLLLLGGMMVAAVVLFPLG